MKWTIEALKEQTSKYTTKKEFRKNCPSAYSAAWSRGLIDEICSHMISARTTWTLDKIKIDALRYDNRSDFHKNSRGAYAAAQRLYILDEVCSHMTKKIERWSHEKVWKVVNSVKSLTEFHIEYRGAYDYARRNNLIPSITEKLGRKQIKWSHDSVKEIAKQYETRYEFKLEYNGAHTYARKNGILDEVCSHMPAIGTHYKRCVYAIFDDTNIYIGLTYNFEKRKHSRPAVAELRKRGRYVKLTEYLPVNIAAGVEKELIKSYRKDPNYNCINIHDGGGLGACRLNPKYYENTN